MCGIKSTVILRTYVSGIRLLHSTRTGCQLSDYYRFRTCVLWATLALDLYASWNCGIVQLYPYYKYHKRDIHSIQSKDLTQVKTRRGDIRRHWNKNRSPAERSWPRSQTWRLTKEQQLTKNISGTQWLFQFFKYVWRIWIFIIFLITIKRVWRRVRRRRWKVWLSKERLNYRLLTIDCSWVCHHDHSLKYLDNRNFK